MSNITTFLEGAVQDWAFAGTDMSTAPTNIYVALHSADPGNDASSDELSAGDYSRYESSTSDWAEAESPDPTVVENSTEFSFGEATSDWGTVSHVSLWDSSTGGNSLWQGSLDASKTVDTGDELIFRSNDIRVELS